MADPRDEFRRYRREAQHDPQAAARWGYWSTLGRIRTMRAAGLEWPQVADLLGLDPQTQGTWSLRMGDRRVRVIAAMLQEERDS